MFTPLLPSNHQDVYVVVMEYLTGEHYSLLNTVEDISVWTPSDLKVHMAYSIPAMRTCRMAAVDRESVGEISLDAWWAVLSYGVACVFEVDGSWTNNHMEGWHSKLALFSHIWWMSSKSKHFTLAMQYICRVLGNITSLLPYCTSAAGTSDNTATDEWCFPVHGK